MTEFIFDDLTIENILEYEKDSKVFNNTKEGIEKDHIDILSFDDERLGSSVEKLDIAICKNGVWEILDITDKVADYNKIPIQYLVGDIDYDKVMVIIRRMSDMVLDATKTGISHYIYNKIDESLKYIIDDINVFGMLANYQIVLDMSSEMFNKINQISDIRDREFLNSKVCITVKGSEVVGE